MEVHQHTHTPRKKWTHYLWEFLMLFLAVTLGFFVENQREGLVEHRREIRYMQNLLQDLSRDNAAMRIQLLFQKRAVIFADSLVDVINLPDRNDFLLALYQYQFKTMNIQKARAIRLIDLLKNEYHLK